LSLFTEASYRFERIVDPEGVLYAADLACKLIDDLGAGNPVMGVVDAYPGRRPAPEIDLRLSRCGVLMGYVPDAKEAKNALTALGFEVREAHADLWRVKCPSWRPDIQREVDLVEEVARVLGYDRIPERLMYGATTIGMDSKHGRFCDAVREVLAGAGLQEVNCHTLVAPSPLDDPGDGTERVQIRSALSAELSGLRRSLIPGLCDTASRNARRGLGPLAFFEIGSVLGVDGHGAYSERNAIGGLVCGGIVHPSWHRVTGDVAPFYVGKGLVERLLAQWRLTGEFERSSDSRLHPLRQAGVSVNGVRLGLVGELDPEWQERLHLRERCAVFEMQAEPLRAAASARERQSVGLSRFPSVVRDLAPRIPEDVAYVRVERVVREVAAELLEDLVLTDVFSGPPLPEGYRSFTLSLTFRAPDRTLTDSEVDGILDMARRRLMDELGATFQELG
jgi:phenylalanyl-tRNA synthetase beta chain